ncbi:MAG: type II CAAX endopeptidase family protein [Mobilitalea sp.]
MNRVITLLLTVLPYIAAELIQYIVISMLFILFKGTAQEAVYMYSLIGTAVCGLVFFYWYQKEWQGVKTGIIKNIINVKILSILALAAIGCQLFFSGVLSLLQPYFTSVFQDYSKVIESITSVNPILLILMIGFVAPITEELIFRGVVFHLANRQVGFFGANLLQAVLFGIYHGNLVQGIYAAILGFILGVICYKFKSLLAAIILHIFINLSSLLLPLIPDQMLYRIFMLLAGGICGVISFFYLVKREEWQQRI